MSSSSINKLIASRGEQDSSINRLKQIIPLKLDTRICDDIFAIPSASSTKAYARYFETDLPQSARNTSDFVATAKSLDISPLASIPRASSQYTYSAVIRACKIDMVGEKEAIGNTEMEWMADTVVSSYNEQTNKELLQSTTTVPPNTYFTDGYVSGQGQMQLHNTQAQAGLIDATTQSLIYPDPIFDTPLYNQGPYYMTPPMVQQPMQQVYLQHPSMMGFGTPGFMPSHGYLGQLMNQSSSLYPQPNTTYSQVPAVQPQSFLTTGMDPVALSHASRTIPDSPVKFGKRCSERLRRRQRRHQKLESPPSSSDYESDGAESSTSEVPTQRRHRVKYSRSERKYDVEDPSTDTAVERYKPEAPKRDADKPWIRINKTTKGLSSRTGKINNFDNGYENVSNPFPRWSSSTGFYFQYDQWGGLCQPTTNKSTQAKVSYTTEQIRQFILEHPQDLNCNRKLVLWIQQVPSDSNRRYPTEHAHSCRFDECPEKAFKRNIRCGYYQVAFDEKWTTHGDVTDPFHMAGFVHLYCLERFLDFPEICRLADVRIDGRKIHPSEPKGEFSGSLLRKGTRGNEYDIGVEFVKLVRAGKLSSKYPTYPIHALTLVGGRKDHKSTLTYAMTHEKNKFVTPSKAAQSDERGLKNSFIEVNAGDLQMRTDAMLAIKERKRQGLSADLIEEVAAPIQRDPVAPSARSHKRKAHVELSSDEDSEDNAEEYRRQRRRRKNARRVRDSRCGRRNGFGEDDDD